MAIGLAALESESCFALFFGLPGTGKSKFPYQLGRTLNASFEANYSLVYAQCDQLLAKITSGQANSTDVIEELENKRKLAYEHKPAILVFDEFDSFSSQISGSEAHTAMLTRWMRQYANDAPGQTLTIGTTNWPYSIDISIWRRISAHFFFDITPPEVVSQMLENCLKISNSVEVGNKVCKMLADNNCISLASDIVKACKQLKKHCSEPQKMDVDDLCRDLVALTSGAPKILVENYWREHKDIINRAQEQMVYWGSQFGKTYKPLWTAESQKRKA
jgi:AAA+ superfamily predicted ATPase